MSPPGLQHSLPPSGPLPQLRRLRGPRGEDPERRQRVGQLSHPSVPGLPQEAHDRLGTNPPPEAKCCTQHVQVTQKPIDTSAVFLYTVA